MELATGSYQGKRFSRIFTTILVIISLLAFAALDSGSSLLRAEAQAQKHARPLTLEEMSAQYIAMRHQAGHFDGAPWNNDVDLWSGKKHILMKALSNRLASITADRQQVIRVMGMPDQVVTRSTAGFEELPEQSRDGEVLVYYWRNLHDYLYFSCSHADTCIPDWWYSLE